MSALTKTETECDYLRDFRCDACGKLLFKGILMMCSIQIKCRKCGNLVNFSRLTDSFGPNVCTMLMALNGTIVGASPNLIKRLDSRGYNQLAGSTAQALFARLGHPSCSLALLKAWSLPNHATNILGLTDTAAIPDDNSNVLQLKWDFINQDSQEYMLVNLQFIIDVIDAPEVAITEPILDVNSTIDILAEA
jgi:hypothetical protein